MTNSQFTTDLSTPATAHIRSLKPAVEMTGIYKKGRRIDTHYTFCDKCAAKPQ